MCGGGWWCTPSPPDIMDESIDAVLCSFSADGVRREGGGGWGGAVAYGVAARV